MDNWHRSLRWRLQFWHALILLLVVGALSGLLLREIARARWDDVDGELLTTARIVEGALRDLPPPILDSMGQDVGRRRPPRRGPRGEPGPPPGPPPGSSESPARSTDEPGILRQLTDIEQATGNTLDPATARWLTDRMPTVLEQLGRRESPGYFILLNEQSEIVSSLNIPVNWQYHPPFRRDAEDRLDTHGINIDHFRELTVLGPHHTTIIVGLDVGHEHARLMQTSLTLGLASLGVLLIGLGGGWWLSGRAIRPIERMSDTARTITAADLSKRMPLSNVDLELAELGTVLNGMLDRLESSFHQQRQFVADASHELRTPLSVILTSAQFALLRDRSPAEYREQFEKCERAGGRMRALVESLLSMARLEANQFALSLVELDFTKVVSEVVESLDPFAKQCNVQISTKLEPCSIVGDQLQLAQMISNLVTNAIKYNRPSGSVTIVLTESADHVNLEVQDTGIGIADQDLPHVFDRFYQADQARSQFGHSNHAEHRFGSGSGLGLAIAQRITQLHGGEISIDSTPGVGTTVHVKLPKVRP
ncbi:MAG: HAMP domain-containing protein [Planctomycetales bacterium]|nr:HAMP domain-containing protein [Planctomycetales bacterium]